MSGHFRKVSVRCEWKVTFEAEKGGGPAIVMKIPGKEVFDSPGAPDRGLTEEQVRMLADEIGRLLSDRLHDPNTLRSV